MTVTIYGRAIPLSNQSPFCIEHEYVYYPKEVTELILYDIPKLQNVSDLGHDHRQAGLQ